ncbi:serine hydrolase domain-containing protein [Aliikangiella sp. IMCC44359]|uniref:serine hydrolase domain-containing protein n=1 Tax=Aliikangiella sp. IMCC44359 TaxID=3459125 RepID=UPI00403AF1FB
MVKLGFNGFFVIGMLSLMLGCNSSSIENFVDRCVPVSKSSDNKYEKKLRKECYSGSVLIAKDGNIIFENGFGKRNRKTDAKNKITTIFRLGTITKQFTAAAIMILQERDLIDIDEPINTYLPDYPNGDLITARHLMNHTAGVPNYNKISAISGALDEEMTPTELVNHIKKLPLEFTPGAKYSYSNSGYTLLGYLIETVYGVTYERAIQQLIFDPLGMNDSEYGERYITGSNKALGYTQKGKNSRNISMSIPYAAGALSSTVVDLHKWERSFYTNALLSESSKEGIFTPGLGNYGLGWDIHTTPTLKHSHGGGISGFSSHIARYPQEGLVIIMLSNVESNKLNVLSSHLYNLYKN